LKSHFYTEQSLMTTFIDLILIKNFIPEFIICHFSLLCYMPLIKSPKQRLETYWFCSVSYYYYMHPDCCRVMYCYSMFLFQYYYYYSTHFCPLDFSEMPWSNIMKPCRNIICYVKLVFKGLIFSKWLPLPWKRPKC
jgi:hypothetical protein